MDRTSILYGVVPLGALPLVYCGGSQAPAAPHTSSPPATDAPAREAPRRELIVPGEMYAVASRFGDLVFTAGHLGDARGDDFTEDVNFARRDRADACSIGSGARHAPAGEHLSLGLG
jgi:hypothetical protein